MIYWEFPPPKTPEYARLKRDTTLDYGVYTAILTFGCVLLLPLASSAAATATHSRTLNLWWPVRALHRSHRCRAAIRTVLHHYTVIKILLFWGSVLAVLSLKDTRRDLGLLGARLGRVLAIALTPVLFLTLRPLPLPNTLYLLLLPLHKWLLRIVVLQAALHTAVYACIYTHQRTWWKIWKPENLHGVAAMFGFACIALTLLLPVRRWLYRVFYINHYLWTWVVVVCLHFHARPGIPHFTAMNVAILVAQIAYRLLLSSTTHVEVHDILPNLELVVFPTSALACVGNQPAAHVRLAEHLRLWIRRALLQAVPLYHPYTVALLPLDRDQKLVVRKSRFRIRSSNRYTIAGVYLPRLGFIHPKKWVPGAPAPNHRFFGGQLPFNMLMDIRALRVLLVVGGSAISVALPILRVLTYNGIDTRLMWVIRDINDVKILRHFNVLGDCIEVYVTGDYPTNAGSQPRLRSAFEMNAQPPSQLDSAPEFRDVEADPMDSGVLDSDTLRPHTPPQETLSPRSGSVLPRTPRTPRRLMLVPNLLPHPTGTPLQLGDLARVGVDREYQLEDVDVDLDPEECGFDDLTDVTGVAGGETYGEVDFTAAYSANVPRYTPLEARSKSLGNIGGFGKASFAQFPAVPLSDSPSDTQPLLGKPSVTWGSTEAVRHKALVVSSQARHDFGPLPLLLRRHIPDGTKVLRGRPKLDGHTHHWCVNTSCSGPVLGADGDAVCCKDARSQEDLAEQARAEDERRRNCWVVAAGPGGLVSNVELWARDHGFNFHEESFSI